jgi:hypothetical protein
MYTFPNKNDVPNYIIKKYFKNKIFYPNKITYSYGVAGQYLKRKKLEFLENASLPTAPNLTSTILPFKVEQLSSVRFRGVN